MNDNFIRLYGHLFPPSAPPEGFHYTPEDQLALDLTRPFLDDYFAGVPLALPLLVNFGQLIFDGSCVENKDYHFYMKTKEKLYCHLFSLAWSLRNKRISNPSILPRNALLIRIEAASMHKQWALISGVLPLLENIPKWLVCGECRVPDHCERTNLPSIPSNYYFTYDSIRIFVNLYYGNLQYWHNKIKTSLEKAHLPLKVIDKMKIVLADTLMQGIQTRSLLSITFPKMIVVDCDHHMRSSWLVLLGKQMGIKTITLQHGNIPDYIGFLPLWADYALLWGNEYAKTFKAFGTADEKIRLVGCPRIDDKHCSSEHLDAVKSSYGINEKDIIVLLATENGIMSDRVQLASTVFYAVKQVPNHTLVIKCHPAESKGLYQEMFAGEAKVKVFSDSEMNLDLSLSLADVCVVELSSVANDALVKGKPVIVLSVKRDQIANNKIAAAGLCCVAKSAIELEYILKKRDYDWNLNPGLSNRVTAFIEDFCIAYGEESNRLTASAINSIWVGDINSEVMSNG
jgi:hypothetical protein